MRRGFTLIELLVVISIIATLMGMLASIIPVSMRFAKRANTQSTIRKVETALHLFKADVRVYPWDCFAKAKSAAGFNQTWPDLTAGETWSNRLAYHLATDPKDPASGYPPQTISNVVSDARTARERFSYSLVWSDANSDRAVSADELSESINAASPVFRGSDIVPFAFVGASPLYNNRLQEAIVLNRLAQSRASLAMFSGAVQLAGPKVTKIDQSGTVTTVADRSGTRVVPAASLLSAGEPGWADDYLRGQLQKSEYDGQAVIDAWRHPLVYLCQVLPGAQPGQARPLDLKIVRLVDPVRYDLATRGRLAFNDPTLTASARVDRRIAVAAGQINEFEIFSVGPDGLFDWDRTARAGRDDIANTPYDKGLQ